MFKLRTVDKREVCGVGKPRPRGVYVTPSCVAYVVLTSTVLQNMIGNCESDNIVGIMCTGRDHCFAVVV